jgi:predicted GNAT family acetyltransferase
VRRRSSRLLIRPRRRSSRRLIQPHRIPNVHRSGTVNTVDHDTEAQRFSTVMDGQQAVLDYQVSSRIMTITHTGVPPAIAGRGIAAELMHAAVEAARAAGWTVNPVCSYAAAYMRRHPEGSERQHEEDLLDEALEESFPASDPPSVGASN